MPTPPSPTPGPTPSKPGTSTSALPTQPTYVGSATPTTKTTSSTNNPDDVWGLGALYGQPIILGSNYRTPVGPDQGKGSDDNNGTLVQGTTQDIMKNVIDAWAAQAAERKANPNQLTTYEQIQQELFAAGAYGQTDYKNIGAGQWTAQTQNALQAMLTQYEEVRKSGNPVSWSEFLQGNSGGSNPDGPGGVGSGSSTAAVQAQLADPTAIRQQAQAAAQNALGHGLTSSQLDKFVNEFQSLQKSDQFSTASTATTPDLGSEANKYAQSVDPNGFKSYQADAYTNTLVNMFIPSSSARPNITPTPAA